MRVLIETGKAQNQEHYEFPGTKTSYGRKTQQGINRQNNQRRLQNR